MPDGTNKGQIQLLPRRSQVLTHCATDCSRAVGAQPKYFVTTPQQQRPVRKCFLTPQAGKLFRPKTRRSA
jgi:hypothetical protein